MSKVDRIVSDPLKNFKFRVNFPNAHDYGAGTGYIGFMSVSGISVNTDVIPYREGGYPTSPHKLPGQTDFQPVTFSKGLAVGDKFMMSWMRDLMAATAGSSGDGVNDYNFRTDVQVEILSHPTRKGEGIVKARFRLNNAWPTTVSFSDLDAGSNQIVINQMTLVYEGFEDSLASANIGAIAPTFAAAA